jgi:uncharacterized protein (DUF885 family)
MSAAPRPEAHGSRAAALVARACLGALLLAAAACPAKPTPTTPPPVTTADPRSPLATATDEILDAWLQSNPVGATSLGDHRFDGAWPKLAPADLEADLRRIEDGLAKLAAIDPATLSPTERVDLEILRNDLELQRFGHEVEKPWTTSPLAYAGTIGTGLDDLVSRDYAPVSERARAAADRLEGLPAFVEQAVQNLQPGQTTQPHTEVARGQLDGALLLLDEIPGRLEGADAAQLGRIAAATPPAREALQKLRDHVEALLPAANAPWRLGKEAFERKLRLTLHTELSADEIRRLAILEHAAVRVRMVELAAELAEVMFTPAERRAIERKAKGDKQAALVTAVLDALAGAHVAPAQLRDSIESTLGRLDAFVREQGLVTLDDAEVLKVIWTPPYQRGVAIAGLAAPGPLDAGTPGLPSFYLVQPVPEEWDEAVKTSFLREYNDFMLEILSIHEAIPGHFVQLYYGKREPSKIRKVLANGPFVEGWAVYAERIMVEAGYSGATLSSLPAHVSGKRLKKVLESPELRAKAIALHGQKFYLRSVTNAILDHSIHAGAMDELEALELMVFRSFQQEGEAKAKWVRAQVSSTQLSTYFVGAQAWFRLRKQAEARAAAAGQAFDAKAFHDQALSYGAPPVHMLPALMGWSDAAPAPAPTGDAAPVEDAAPAPAEDAATPAAQPSAP